MASSRSRRMAFTLVELLICVSIIAVLLSILLPAIAKVRAGARRAVCMSNLHQIGALITAYAGDNHGEIPAVYGLAAGDAHPHPMTWLGPRIPGEGIEGIGGVLLLVKAPIGIGTGKYLSNAQIFFCPADTRGIEARRPADDFSRLFPTVPNFRSMSYSYCYVPQGGDSLAEWHSLKPDVKPQGWVHNDYAGLERHSIGQHQAAARAVMVCPASAKEHSRHDEGNVLYLDGHVITAYERYFAIRPPVTSLAEEGKQLMEDLDSLAAGS